jgi:hypothetical protein
MFRTAYSTNAASSFLSKDLLGRLTIASAEGTLVKLDPNIPSLLGLVDRGPAGKEIPPFEHPVYLGNSKSAEPGTPGGVWVIDLRPYATRVVAQDGAVSIPTDGPARILLNRAKLEMYWNQYKPGEMMFWGDLPFVVFARWMTGLMKGRMQLAPNDVAQVQALSAFYFYCLFYNEEEFDAKKIEFAATRVSRVLGIEADKVKAWCAQVGYMANINDFALKLTEVVDNPSIRMIDAKYLINLTMNSWFGSADAKALIAVALEFPPAFIAMVLAAGETSQYRKSTIGEAVEREKSKWRFNEYHRLAFDALKSLK